MAPAHAQWTVSVNSDLPGQLKDSLTQIWDALKNAALNAVVRLVSYAMRKVAYDGAVWLASGGKGQTPLAYNKGFVDYMKDVNNEAFGAAIESLADKRSGIGINLCTIPDIKVDLALKVGLRLPGASGLGASGAAGQQKPSCSFSQFAQNWGNGDTWKSRFTAAGNSIEQQFNAAISNADQTDFGLYLNSKQFIDTSIAQKLAGEQLQRLEGNGVMPKTTAISGQITTPAVTMSEEFKKDAPRTQQEKDEQQIAALLASGNIQVIPTILGIFVNTLGSTMLKNYQEQGILPFGIGCKDGSQNCLGSDQASQFTSSGILGGRQQAQQFFQSILQTVEVQTLDNYDLVGQLSSCPDVQGLYNCRLDANLVRGLKQTESGDAVTIQKAIDTGILNPNWQLLPPSRQAENMDKNCYNRAFCYGNIKVLRQARILPLGFEIAAALSNPDNPWTLGQIVKGFNDCTFVNGVAVIDLEHKPFCHLIDPNWVLVAPQSQCRAAVWGPDRASEGAPYRRQECADLTTCVSYDQKGNCTNFAYCAREKNTWQFKADSCDAQYRTCRTFKDTDGNAVSYLYRTINTSMCTEQNIGCTFYSLTKDIATGDWKGPGTSGAVANGMYFNGQVSKSCAQSSAGCTAFTYASSTDVTLYMKQAPEYLGCYDSDPTTPGVQWPQTTADLNKLPENPACDAYASACTQNEVGCNMYTPVDKKLQSVPGKFAAENVCSDKCVGYDTYREMPSNYSNGQNVAYIIPSSGQACTSANEGCTGFTNLKTVSNNQTEQTEYFSYLRSCVTPQQKTGKNFFTYEGSVTGGGFQLKTYRLVENDVAEDNDPLNSNNEVGAPRYFYRTPDERAQYSSECNEANYKKPSANPDCRQFNDDKGNVYYRLLSKTIPVTADCTAYRRNETEMYVAAGVPDANTCTNVYSGFWNNNTCQVCFQNGRYVDGQCLYDGLPADAQNTAGTSHSCPQEADSCRAYKGNAGNNIKVIGGKDDTFEEASSTDALANWSATGGTARITTESTHVGGHSLGYAGNGTVRKTNQLTIGKSYDLTFWAKGVGGSQVTVRFVSADGSFTKDFGIITPSDAWNLYHFGPLELVSGNNTLTTSTINLTFAVQGQTNIFLDNVRLVEVTDYLYLVKKSLKVDAACDSVPDDNLPGEALGCTAYKDPAGNTINLTGFSFLCREKSIGCVGVYDTHNTADPAPQAFGVQISGAGGGTATLNIGLGASNPSCQVPVGSTFCYVDVPSGFTSAAIQNAGGKFVSSTVYIPADNQPPATPLYLVSNKAASCNRVDLGCQNMGMLKSTPQGPMYVTTTVKNDPTAYGTQLCSAEALGCTKFTDTAGSNAYFKDPQLLGQKICSYKTDVLINGSLHNGWFWKSVGTCSNNATLCSSNNDCTTGASCQGVGTVPCYSDYVDGDGSYGIWSYGVPAKYKDFVGECPAEANMCTEFIDHSDNDRPYYFLKNSKISNTDCNGQVSQKSGCVLFDQTDNPNKFWSTSETYTRSSAADGQAIPPVSTANNDANIVIKVQPGRVCGEWLQCLSSHPVNDPLTGKIKSVCDQLGRCDQAAAASGDAVSACAHWVTVKTPYTSRPLSKDLYVGRDVTWKGMDFSGLSLVDNYPLDQLSQVNIDLKAVGSTGWRLVKVVPCGGNTSIGGNSVCVDPSPQSSSAVCVPAVDDPQCGVGGEFNIPCNPLARCGTAALPGVCTKSGVCVENIAGAPDAKLSETSQPQACRAYPEKDSPFPNQPTVVNNGEFKGVNYCNEGKNPSTWSGISNLCECNYTRVQYGEYLTKFWNYTRPNNVDPIGGTTMAGHIPDGLCQGGDRNGYECSRNSDCHQLTNVGAASDFALSNTANATLGPDNKPVIDGSCVLHKRADPFLGWQGYCVEEDMTRPLNGDPNQHPCLTWWPVDSLSGAADINNQHTEAGYLNPNPGGTYYCLASNGGGGGAAWDTNNTNNIRDYYAQITRNIDFGSTPRGGGDQRNWGGASDGDQFWRAFYGANPSEANIHLQDIERVELAVIAADDADPTPGTTFYIWPDDLTAADGTPQGTYNGVITGDNWDKIRPGIALTGKYLGLHNELIWFWSSSHHDGGQTFQYIQPNGDVCYSPSGAGAHNCDIQNGNYALAGNIFGTLYSNHVPLSNVENGVDGGLTHDIGIWDLARSNHDICPNGSSDYDAGAVKNAGGNWNAFRLRFDPVNGRFLGYYTAFCDDSSGDGGLIFKVTFRLKEWCSIIADTHVNYTDDNTAVAWTDRLWSATKAPYTLNTLKYGPVTANAPYDFAAPYTPSFGSLGINGFNNTQKINFVKPQLVKDANGQFVCGPNVSSCTFTLADSLLSSQGTSPRETVVAAGLPYSCKEGTGKNCVGVSGNTYYLTNADTNAAAFGLGNTGESSLDQLFARVFSISQYNYALGGNGDRYLGGAAFNHTNNIGAGNNNMAPTVFSLESCTPDGKCQEGNAGRFSINRTSSADILLYGTSKVAKVDFYATADENQMPLREIKVDWNDGDISAPGRGAYRNARGLQQATCNVSGNCQLVDAKLTNYQVTNGQKPVPCVNGQCPLVSQCVQETDAHNFGLITGRTCDSSYFEFTHSYQCIAGQQNNWHANSADCGARPDLFPNGCCIYKPKVQIKDNWGFCSGNACGTNVSPGGTLCYDDNAGGGVMDECAKNPSAWIQYGSWMQNGRSVIVKPAN